MSTTNTIIVVILVMGLAVLGYFFLMPSGSPLSPEAPGTAMEETQIGSETMVAATASFNEFEKALEADLGLEANAAMDSGDADAALSADQEAVINLTESTNDSNF